MFYKNPERLILLDEKKSILAPVEHRVFLFMAHLALVILPIKWG